MLTLEEIRERLKDRRLQVVAESTNMHYNTIKSVRDNENGRPSYDTIKALSDYLNK